MATLGGADGMFPAVSRSEAMLVAVVVYGGGGFSRALVTIVYHGGVCVRQDT